VALNSYSNLKAALRNRSHRSDMPDDLLDDFIDLAEADMNQRLRVKEMLVRATATSGSDEFLALPTGFIRMRTMYALSGGTKHEVDFRVPKTLKRQAGSGIPTQYAVGSQLEFNRIPSTMTFSMDYYKRLTPLDDTNTVNDILTFFPQVYFYGALKHLYDWTDQDAQHAKYLTMFNQEITDTNKADKKDAIGPAPATRISGTTP